MRLAVTLVTVLLAPAVPLAAAPPTGGPPSGPTTAVDLGVRFQLPAGFQVKQTTEREPGEPEHALWVATRGRVELRVEVEPGEARCDEAAVGAAPRPGRSAAGLPTCEASMAAPPNLDAAIGPRRATVITVRFAGRYLSVLAFAPDQAEATRLARQVAESAVEVPAAPEPAPSAAPARPSPASGG